MDILLFEYGRVGFIWIRWFLENKGVLILFWLFCVNGVIFVTVDSVKFVYCDGQRVRIEYIAMNFYVVNDLFVNVCDDYDIINVDNIRQILDFKDRYISRSPISQNADVLIIRNAYGHPLMRSWQLMSLDNFPVDVQARAHKSVGEYMKMVVVGN